MRLYSTASYFDGVRVCVSDVTDHDFVGAGARGRCTERERREQCNRRDDYKDAGFHWCISLAFISGQMRLS